MARVTLRAVFPLIVLAAPALFPPGLPSSTGAAGPAFAAESRTPDARPALGYVAEVPPETPAQREERHRRVAERRKGPAIMVHRGAAAFAPENTLEAYAAAMDYGADGCEIDLRRTQDGVLVLFHDDMLDHLTDGIGTVEEVTCYELLSLRPRFRYGTATRSTRPPTFAAVLALARQRAMLLHLDVKRPGLEADLSRMLDAADAWDHVVAVNMETAPGLGRDPRVGLLRYKGPALYADRRDVDPEAVRKQLARPGELVMVDDPRVAARALQRPPYAPVPLPRGLRREWPRRVAPAPPLAAPLVPSIYLRTRAWATDARSGKQLLSLLESDSPGERLEPDGTGEYQQRRTEHILDRAWAAQRLGARGEGLPQRLGLPASRERRDAVKLLTEQVRRRSLHRDWFYHGLDGAMAVQALGDLRAQEAAPALVEAFLRVDPALEKARDPRFGPNPLGWTDFRVKMYVLPALGELRAPEGKRFLQEYVAMPPARARELAPLQYEEATRALLRHPLEGTELEALLRSENPAVRGTALLDCLDHPSKEREAALRAAAPWALELPSAARPLPRR